jgi:RecA/RadA recombinase
MAKEEVAEEKPLDLDELFESEAKKLDLPVVNLNRGTYVQDSVSTGSLVIDLIMGGGWPAGRYVNVHGGEGSGKTTLQLTTMAEAIRNKIYVFHFDAEGSADPMYMRRIGIQVDWVKEYASWQKKNWEPVYYRYFQPTTGEQIFRYMHRILQKLPPRNDGLPTCLFFLDSLAAVLPEARDENDEKSPMAQLAKMYSEQFPLIKSPLAQTRSLFFASNQVRLRPNAYGNPEYEPGGEACKFYSDARLKLKKTVGPGLTSYVEEEPCWDANGMDRYVYIKAATIKNKMFSPFRETIFRIWFEERGAPGRGIDPVYDTFQFLNETGQIELKKENIFISSDSVVIQPWVGKYTWVEFKKLILDPKNLTENAGLTLRKACRKQIENGEAFDKYFNNVGQVKVPVSHMHEAGADVEGEEEPENRSKKKNKNQVKIEEMQNQVPQVVKV